MVSIGRETILFDIVMTDCGPKRIEAMAVIRRSRPELTLAGAKSLIETLPAVVLTKIDLDTIGAVLASFRTVGARVELAGPHAKDPWILQKLKDFDEGRQIFRW